MTTNQIRTKFLEFFKSKGHSIIASDSVVPKDDPTVLFTTAGMQQFKPQFLGRIDGYTRAATSQKCLRTDDLDKIGKTPCHHTFFEMLGNFSFGDYFKKEAIAWAWEFLTKEMKLSGDKLWVSVYEEDQEAYDEWVKMGFPKEKIVRLGDKDNFWPAEAKKNGPNGPCGPCTEIFFDYGVNPNCKSQKCDPSCSCGRFTEVWNLVFTQFNRKDGGILEPLPGKNIDTGMGLERLASVVQGVKSNYETDNFAVILKVIKDTFAANNAKLTESEFRIVADHIRAITFGISDGVIPSNEGRGYVMRKLIVDITDLAIRAGVEKPIIHTFVDVIVDVHKEPYPELIGKASDVKDAIKRIEESFIKVRRERIPELKEKLTAKGVDLGSLFFLYRDTHGLTLSTICEVAKESGVSQHTIDEAIKSYEVKMEEQKERSRAGSKMTGERFADKDVELNVPKTQFVGYEVTKAQVKVLKIIEGAKEAAVASKGQKVLVILDRTPFYAESGGQVGDTGFLSSPQGKLRVLDTQKTNDIFIHSCEVLEGQTATGDMLEAEVDEARRQAIKRNHTATHMLQSALRETLGSHIKQQGSLVEEGRLRFDFAHPSGIKPEQMQKIESRLSEFIKKADPVSVEVLPIEEAKKKGALAFFAEKYGATVRVVSIGDYSREFCGGTHLASTSEVEAIKIVSEGSVAQGIRRIEALTGKAVVSEFLNKKNEEEQARLQIQKQKEQDKQQAAANFQKIASSADDLIKNTATVKGTNVLIQCLDNVDIGSLRKLSDILRKKLASGVFVLGGKSQEDASLVVSVSDDLVARGIKANDIVGRIAPLFGASGGGKPQLAQAGSKEPQKIESALSQAKDLVIL